jgi:hypothetical protein
MVVSIPTVHLRQFGEVPAEHKENISCRLSSALRRGARKPRDIAAKNVLGRRIERRKGYAGRNRQLVKAARWLARRAPGTHQASGAALAGGNTGVDVELEPVISKTWFEADDLAGPRVRIHFPPAAGRVRTRFQASPLTTWAAY